MLQDMFDQQQQQLQIDDISSPISAQIFDFYDPDLFSETFQNSEVTSCSNGCYEDNSSPFPSEIDKFNNSYQCNNNNANNNTTPTTTTTTSTTTTTTTTSSAAAATNLSIIFDSQEDIDNDISASIDFSQFDFSPSSMLLQPNQIPISDTVNVDGLSVSRYPTEPLNNPLRCPPHTPSILEEDSLSSVPSCSFLGPYMPVSATMTAAFSADGTGIFTGSVLRGSELQLQELDFQGDNGGTFCPDSMQRVFNPGYLQALSVESQQMVGGAASSTPIVSEISSLEDSTFKVGKLSVEQRKEKIHRYMKKRNERNFSKKIKYACRKTLADSRPRVRGRFAKNCDFGETIRTTCSTHGEDDDEEVVAKEEDEMVDSSDIFAHISGVNSFKCNLPIQSWI